LSSARAYTRAESRVNMMVPRLSSASLIVFATVAGCAKPTAVKEMLSACGTGWTLVRMVDHGREVTLPRDSAGTLECPREGFVGGFAFVNQFRVPTDEDQETLGGSGAQVHQTAAGGTPERMAAQLRYLDLLVNVDRVQRTPQRLILICSKRQGRLEFVPGIVPGATPWSRRPVEHQSERGARQQ
jgi:hypothetical protein